MMLIISSYLFITSLIWYFMLCRFERNNEEHITDEDLADIAFFSLTWIMHLVTLILLTFIWQIVKLFNKILQWKLDRENTQMLRDDPYNHFARSQLIFREWQRYYEVPESIAIKVMKKLILKSQRSEPL